MKILSFTTVYPNAAQPGVGVFVRERLRHAARLADLRVVAPVPWFPFGHRITPQTRPRLSSRVERGEIEVQHPRFFSVPGVFKALDGLFLFLSSVAAVRRLKREGFDFDLIDAHFAYPDGLAAVLLGLLFRRPVVVTLRGTEIPLSAPRLRRLQIRVVLRRASIVVVLSRALEALARESGAGPEKIVRIPNGVDGAAFRPIQREEARRPLGLPADARIVVSAGGLCRRKGHHRLVEIWPEVRRDVPGAMLLIVGGPTAEGDETDALLRKIGERGLGSDVRLVGPRPHEEMPLWLSAADLFVLATTNEGSCNVVREALSCGTPVVTTPVGDNAEVVREPQGAPQSPPNWAGSRRASANNEMSLGGRRIPAFQGGVLQPACGVLVRPDETSALARAVIEGLTRVWDREGVRSSVASESWDGVAARVADVWRSVANVDEEEVRVLERSQARS